MAYINTTSTSTSITARLYGLDTSYARDDRVCTWYLDGVKRGTSKLGASISSGGTYNFTNLKPSTTYEIHVEITAEGWSSVVELDTEASTTAPEVDAWSWSDSNGSASASQTSSAYNAIRNKGKLSNFSYLVWNDMVDKVKEVQEAKGVEWKTKYASYNATKMSSSDKRLTAIRFNSLRYNIGFYYSTGISDVYKGDTVYGSYFITLANCINNWIEE